MGTVIDQNLSFDGGVSTADQFSSSKDFANITLPTAAAFFLDVDLANGPLSITLQANVDPSGTSVLDWMDVASTSLRILDTTNSVFLDQTDTSIESSKLRGGIVKGSSSNSVLLFQFEPVLAAYRLRFQIAAATLGNINNILSTH